MSRLDCEIVMLIAAGPVWCPQDSLVTMITAVCDANPLNMSPRRPRHIDTQLSPSPSWVTGQIPGAFRPLPG